ncbi:unnamed protein product [Hymenolepis diminuta]|uniref:Transposase n=1 Tax=Hymenolepis diminuta TaxID=6216 RepID=A0A0R3SA71_HYMDI|nr:unnamed protein product [Hymenolepis diminuta]VUZ52214.1 unnamed protein product [Hymenolepis diminuta]
MRVTTSDIRRMVEHSQLMALKLRDYLDIGFPVQEGQKSESDLGTAGRSETKNENETKSRTSAKLVNDKR